jgi:6-phosphofructokinase 1
MIKMKLFLSYHFPDDESFIKRVSYYLRKQLNLQPYCYSDESHTEGWQSEIGTKLWDTNAFLLFLGQTLGNTQSIETKSAIRHKHELGADYRLLFIKLPNAIELPHQLELFKDYSPPAIVVQTVNENCARECAIQITESLLGINEWIPDDDLPIGYPFDYEKKIIEEYSKGELSTELIARGCPKKWPKVEKKVGDKINQVDTAEVGLFADWDYKENVRRSEDPQVIVAALSDFHPGDLISKGLTLPEARARKYLYYPQRPNKALSIGIMVSGGIAPGINSVISGIVERQLLYAERNGYTSRLTIDGYYNGLNSLVRPGTHRDRLDPIKVTEAANLGGSILGTSRAQDFMVEDPRHVQGCLQNAVRRLGNHGTEILYLIGGDGTMRAAHALHRTAQEMNVNISIVGIPKTMDNDILWVWQSFGFLSSVEWSKEAFQQLHTEASSNPRLCVIQLFGSDSGFVVTHAVTASGVCDLFLIPEVPFEMKVISEYIVQKLNDRYDKSGDREITHGLVVMAETAIPRDAEDYIDEPYVGLTEAEKAEIRSFLVEKKCRVFGQTPDDLRTGGLKLVSKVLQKNIRSMPGNYWQDFRVFTNEPRHLIRSIAPSSSDIIFAHRLGSLAVDCAMAGYTDFMISQWLTEYVMVPLRLVTLGRKRIPKDGIFYKSARASTGQPASLTSKEKNV